MFEWGAIVVWRVHPKPTSDTHAQRTHCLEWKPTERTINSAGIERHNKPPRNLSTQDHHGCRKVGSTEPLHAGITTETRFLLPGTTLL